MTTYTIKISGRCQKNIHYELVYTSADSERSIFSGHDIEGKIAAELCQNCGRITLRAAHIG